MTQFYDLPGDERAYWHERAERETGQSLYDMAPEERADWYERAERESESRGWVWPE